MHAPLRALPSVKRPLQSTPTFSVSVFFWVRRVRSLPLRCCFSSAQRRYEVAFSLLFALDEAAVGAAAQGGVRTEIGATSRTALDNSQAVHRTRPPDVFHRVMMLVGKSCDSVQAAWVM